MRKINTGDIFKLARLLKRINVFEFYKKFQAKGAKIKKLPEKERVVATRELGVEAFVEVLMTITDANIEKEIYSLLEGITGKKNIAEQDIDVTVVDIIEIFKNNDISKVFSLAQG